MNKKIKRNILLNPGPATTSDSVKYAQVIPDICHRESDFVEVLAKVRKDLLKIVNADENYYSSVLFSGSGTLCIDSVLSSLINKNEIALIINNGNYSNRAVHVCQYYNIPYVELKYPDNLLPSLLEVEEALIDNPNISLVYATHHETGTGILNPIKEIGRLAHKYGKIFAVDTTSSFAMIPIDIKEDNIDFLMSSGQKGVMAMAGISFIIGKTEEIEKSEFYPKRSYYCNLFRQYDFFKKKGQLHFTPPIQIIYALNQALDEIFEETLEKKYQRHKQAFDELYKGVKELGFKFYVDKPINSGLLLSIYYQDDKKFSFEKLYDYCYKKGFIIYPEKVIKADTFRLSVFGTITKEDIKDFLEVFKEALALMQKK